MKILITGICGFLGSSLAKELLATDASIQIYGIDNLARPGSELNRRELILRGVHFTHADLRSRSDIDQLPAVDYVIDAAASPSVLAGVDSKTSSRQLLEHNLLGTINLLEYCKRYQAGLILISTSRVYSIAALAGLPVHQENRAFVLDADLEEKHNAIGGLTEKGIAETFSTAAPISLYGSTKLASEMLALEYGDVFGFPVWINRCGVIAGAGQFGKADQGIFTYWIHSYLYRQPLKYIGFGGHGFQVRDCLHPRDLLGLLRQQMAASTFSGPRIINLGGGQANAMSLAQLSDWCAAQFGEQPISRDLQDRPFDIPWFVMDSSLAKTVWGWEPKTSLESILQEIAQHAQLNPQWLTISSSA